MLRNIALGICVLLAISAIPVVFAYGQSFFAEYQVKAIPFGDQVQLVVENYYETGRALLQAALALIAASWGAIALSNNENRRLLATGQAKAMFVLGTFCLVMSALAYVQLSDTLCQYLQRSAATSEHMVPDLRHQYVTGLATAQVWGMVAGALCKGVSIFPSV